MTTLFHRLAAQLCNLTTPISSALCRALQVEMLFWQANTNDYQENTPYADTEDFIESGVEQETPGLTVPAIAPAKTVHNKQSPLVTENLLAAAAIKETTLSESTQRQEKQEKSISKRSFPSKFINTNLTKPITTASTISKQPSVNKTAHSIIHVKSTQPANNFFSKRTADSKKPDQRVHKTAVYEHAPWDLLSETQQFIATVAPKEKSNATLTNSVNVVQPLLKKFWLQPKQQQKKLLSFTENVQQITTSAPITKTTTIQPFINLLWPAPERQQPLPSLITQAAQTAAKNHAVKIHIDRIKIAIKSTKSNVTVKSQPSSSTHSANTLSLIDYLTRHSRSSS